MISYQMLSSQTHESIENSIEDHTGLRMSYEELMEGRRTEPNLEMMASLWVAEKMERVGLVEEQVGEGRRKTQWILIMTELCLITKAVGVPPRMTRLFFPLHPWKGFILHLRFPCLWGSRPHLITTT